MRSTKEQAEQRTPGACSAFEPLFRNPHIATIAGNFWQRPDVNARWPVQAKLYDTEPGVKVLVHSQYPEGKARGEIFLVHGLEGSSEAGYAVSMAYAALEQGFAVHRFNMRACGGTDEVSRTAYHAGQTGDLLLVLKDRKRQSEAPLFLVGYSLGGNVALKLAGETAEEASGLLRGVCAVSTPIDLSSCAHALGTPRNIIYQRRFLARMKERIRRRHELYPDVYSLDNLPKVRTIVDFDEYYTAPLFGFGTAANYFATQSANQFLERIRIPALLVTAQDDPLVPFEVYRTAGIEKNSNLTLIAPEHGGHLGFLAKRNPRFWLDGVLMEWIGKQAG